MADTAAGQLTDLLAGTRRVALVGLAKNTGKTQTLATILPSMRRPDAASGSPRSGATARNTT